MKKQNFFHSTGTEPNRNRNFWDRTEPEPKILEPNRTETENSGIVPPLFCGGSAIDATKSGEIPLLSLSVASKEEEEEESADPENNGEKEKRKFDKKEKD